MPYSYLCIVTISVVKCSRKLVPVISYINSRKQWFPHQTPDLSYCQEATKQQRYLSSRLSCVGQHYSFTSDCYQTLTLKTFSRNVKCLLKGNVSISDSASVTGPGNDPGLCVFLCVSVYESTGAVFVRNPLNRELVATFEIIVSVHDNASDIIDMSVSVPNGKCGCSVSLCLSHPLSTVLFVCSINY